MSYLSLFGLSLQDIKATARLLNIYRLRLLSDKVGYMDFQINKKHQPLGLVPC